ncbi:MAG: DUF3592 domain-containing protein [Ruminococcus sp.]|nr:DUF3592 domain-containing protein [Ruminococcus sp.]
MEIRVNGKSGAGAAFQLIGCGMQILGIFLVFGCMFGFYLVKTFGPYCIDQIHKRSVCTDKVTAVITDAFSEKNSDNKVIHYSILDYEYNGEKYSVKLESGFEGGVSISVSGDGASYQEHEHYIDEETEKEDKESIGEEVPVYVNPKDPTDINVTLNTNLFYILTAVGFLPFILLIIFIIVIVRTVKKKASQLIEQENQTKFV